jgi:hypothetical protein
VSTLCVAFDLPYRLGFPDMDLDDADLLLDTELCDLFNGTAYALSVRKSRRILSNLRALA